MQLIDRIGKRAAGASGKVFNPDKILKMQLAFRRPVDHHIYHQISMKAPYFWVEITCLDSLQEQLHMASPSKENTLVLDGNEPKAAL